MKTIFIALAIWFCFLPSHSFALPNNLRIEVFKSARLLRVYSGEKLLVEYSIGLGTNPVPSKVREGDRATPEGKYFICRKNPKSKFYLSLQINYPNLADASQYQQIKRAAENGLPPPSNTPLGGEIFIHGHGSGSDWTLGCIALNNPEMKKLYDLIPVGTPVNISK
jgi:murein L,D-transpeptidase YafK